MFCGLGNAVARHPMVAKTVVGALCFANLAMGSGKAHATEASVTPAEHQKAGIEALAPEFNMEEELARIKADVDAERPLSSIQVDSPLEQGMDGFDVPSSPERVMAEAETLNQQGPEAQPPREEYGVGDDFTDTSPLDTTRKVEGLRAGINDTSEEMKTTSSKYSQTLTKKAVEQTTAGKSPTAQMLAEAALGLAVDEGMSWFMRETVGKFQKRINQGFDNHLEESSPNISADTLKEIDSLARGERTTIFQGTDVKGIKMGVGGESLDDAKFVVEPNENMRATADLETVGLEINLPKSAKVFGYDVTGGARAEIDHKSGEQRVTFGVNIPLGGSSKSPKGAGR